MIVIISDNSKECDEISCHARARMTGMKCLQFAYSLHKEDMNKKKQHRIHQAGRVQSNPNTMAAAVARCSMYLYMLCSPQGHSWIVDGITQMFPVKSRNELVRNPPD